MFHNIVTTELGSVDYKPGAWPWSTRYLTSRERGRHANGTRAGNPSRQTVGALSVPPGRSMPSLFGDRGQQIDEDRGCSPHKSTLTAGICGKYCLLRRDTV
jgi:hypothetical protein